MKSKSLYLFLVSLFIFFSSFGQSGNQGVLRAGMAKIDITPEFPVRLYGYASRKTLSEGVHDQLYARAVVFENNGEKVVLISSDIGSYSDTVFHVFQNSIISKFNLKESDLFLSTIHSHSSPILSLK